MSSTQLYVGIGIIVALLVVPLLVAVAVRFLIKDDEPEAEGAQIEPAMQFDSLKDFWQSNVPHLLELRDRLIKASAGIMIGGILGSYLVFGNPGGFNVIDVLAQQFIGADYVDSLQTIEIAEAFVASMSVALAIGIALAMPVLVYQIVAFFAPGLYAREKRVVFIALPFVFELFLAGLAFGWLFTVPAAINFLYNFGANANSYEVRPTVNDFLSIILRLMLWNGVIFEMPAIIYLLARIGVVSAQTLANTRRYAIVIIVIFAAFITPTGDPFNLLLLAGPMYLLYEMGILLARFVPKPKDTALPIQVSPGD
ncbi:MAG: twin-arginine translocase subunit TatC [Roseiflexaceae bacterium]|nr:twin-arginine translocase subunit TatC [Roseiflexaceae bacterium]